MSTPSEPTKTGLQDFNAPSSIVSTSSAYQLYYIRFYSAVKRANMPSSYARKYYLFFEFQTSPFITKSIFVPLYLVGHYDLCNFLLLEKTSLVRSDWSRNPLVGYRPRWGTGPIEASTTIYIGCAPGTAGRIGGKTSRKTNIAAEKRDRKAERVDVHWLGKINNVDRLVRIMGDVSWINGTKGIEKAQKLWCTKVAINVNWDSTWVVAG